MKKLSFDEFYEKYKEYKIITQSMKSKYFEKYKFNHSFQIGVIASIYNGVARIKSMFFKKIIFVEGIDFVNKKIYCFERVNKNLFKSRIQILVSVLTAIGVAYIFFL